MWLFGTYINIFLARNKMKRRVSGNGNLELSAVVLLVWMGEYEQWTSATDAGAFLSNQSTNQPPGQGQTCLRRDHLMANASHD